MLEKFSGLEFEKNISKFRKRKREFNCVLFTYSIKRAREVWKFHATVVQRRLRNVQKSVMDVQNNLLFFFAFFCSCRRRRG